MRESQELGIDQNDQNPTNSITQLSKAFDNTIQACKSDPNRPFPTHHTYTVYNTLQADEIITGIDKKLMVTDQSKQKKPTEKKHQGVGTQRKSFTQSHSQSSNSPADMNSAVYENQSKNNATTICLTLLLHKKC